MSNEPALKAIPDDAPAAGPPDAQARLRAEIAEILGTITQAKTALDDARQRHDAAEALLREAQARAQLMLELIVPAAETEPAVAEPEAVAPFDAAHLRSIEEQAFLDALGLYDPVDVAPRAFQEPEVQATEAEAPKAQERVPTVSGVVSQLGRGDPEVVTQEAGEANAVRMLEAMVEELAAAMPVEPRIEAEPQEPETLPAAEAVSETVSAVVADHRSEPEPEAVGTAAPVAVDERSEQPPEDIAASEFSVEPLPEATEPEVQPEPALELLTELEPEPEPEPEPEIEARSAPEPEPEPQALSPEQSAPDVATETSEPDAQRDEAVLEPPVAEPEPASVQTLSDEPSSEPQDQPVEVPAAELAPPSDDTPNQTIPDEAQTGSVELTVSEEPGSPEPEIAIPEPAGVANQTEQPAPRQSRIPENELLTSFAQMATRPFLPPEIGTAVIFQTPRQPSASLPSDPPPTEARSEPSVPAASTTPDAATADARPPTEPVATRLTPREFASDVDLDALLFGPATDTGSDPAPEPVSAPPWPEPASEQPSDVQQPERTAAEQPAWAVDLPVPASARAASPRLPDQPAVPTSAAAPAAAPPASQDAAKPRDSDPLAPLRAMSDEEKIALFE